MLSIARMLGHSWRACLLVRLGFVAQGAATASGGALSGQQAATLFEIDLAAGREAHAA
ncbi:hypothetical protein [Pseudopontixanthobacter vadosimaris]|uniref:hypothetical protein n=1 Tax=Pseudopontixanthobacter vadosimaris TaxID=2726450 RepID=UPI0014727E9F|nr:hypothetical protein [Pseudopontixanthobacter vadosimaris]